MTRDRSLENDGVLPEPLTQPTPSIVNIMRAKSPYIASLALLVSTLGAMSSLGCSAKQHVPLLQSDQAIRVDALGEDVDFQVTAISVREAVFEVVDEGDSSDEGLDGGADGRSPTMSPHEEEAQAVGEAGNGEDGSDSSSEVAKETKEVLGTEVVLRLRAIDEQGRFVGGLDEERFAWDEFLLDGGEDCEIIDTELTEVLEDRAPPVEVMVVADYSGSIWAHWRALDEAIVTLSNELKPDDSIGFIAFDHRTESVLSLGPTKLTWSDVRGLFRRLGGGTHMYTAVDEGLESFEVVDGTTLQETIKLLVLFSDGKDNCATCGAHDAIGLARSAVARGVQVFAIGIGDADFVALDELVRESGGYAHSPHDYEDFAAYFSDLIHSTQNYYQVVIRYACDGSTPRRVGVSVEDPSAGDGEKHVAHRVLPLMGAGDEYQNPPTKPPVRPVESRCLPDAVPSSVRVFFDVDSHDVPASASSDLRTIATALACDGGSKVILEGLTDTTGSQTWNDRLAGNRSRSVREQLVSLGASPGQIELEPLGEGPLESSKSERANNRRVTIHWVPGPRAPR